MGQSECQPLEAAGVWSKPGQAHGAGGGDIITKLLLDNKELRVAEQFSLFGPKRAGVQFLLQC
jgi:hypothetical protein